MICLAAAVTLAFPGSDAKVRAVLMNHYRQVTEALQKKDVSILKTMLTSDYQAKTPAGVAGKDKVIDTFQHQAQLMNHLSWSRNITKLNVSRGQADVVVSGHLTASVGAKPPHKFEMFASSHDLWVKAGSDWKLKSTSVLSNKVLIDGKPMARR